MVLKHTYRIELDMSYLMIFKKSCMKRKLTDALSLPRKDL